MPSRGSRHHTFRGDGGDKWDQDWLDFDAATRKNGTTRSEVIRAYVRFYLRRGTSPKRPPAVSQHPEDNL